jgi:hypothetical protein
MARNGARQEGREIRCFTTAVFDLVDLPADYRDGPPPKHHRLCYYSHVIPCCFAPSPRAARAYTSGGITATPSPPAGTTSPQLPPKPACPMNWRNGPSDPT